MGRHSLRFLGAITVGVSPSLIRPVDLAITREALPRQRMNLLYHEKEKCQVKSVSAYKDILGGLHPSPESALRATRYHIISKRRYKYCGIPNYPMGASEVAEHWDEIVKEITEWERNNS